MTLSATASSSKYSNAWKIFAIILVVNLIQAAFSPLLNDEPYYWLYAQYPAWGYLDHPPLVALMVKIGSMLLPGEIGARLLFVIMGSFTYFFTYLLIEGETDKPINYKLVCLLLFSSFFLNLYSFLSLPDTPLLFFAVLFLYTYRKYLAQDTLLNALAMGVVTTLLLYAKYHGVLLIGFTVLSNLKLFTRKSFYLVMVLTAVLLIPHIMWQLQNDYPSIRFQLFEREKLEGTHDYGYLPRQLALTGPAWILLFSILYRTKNTFQRALKFNVIGIFTFFFISSFKGLINVHWTAIAIPSMLCLAYLFIDNLKKYRLYINLLLIANLLFIIAMRTDFILNIRKFMSYNEENPKLMTSIIKQKSQGNPVVFQNSYNDPSFYWFYQHEKSYGVNTILYKKTQFNYLPGLESEFRGKTVCYVSFSPINKSSQKVDIPKGFTYFVTMIPDFATFDTGLKVRADDLKYLDAGKDNTIKINIDNTLDSASMKIFREKGGYLTLNVINKIDAGDIVYKYDKPLNFSDKEPLSFTFKAPAQKGKYRCIFSFKTNDDFLTGFDSNTYNVEIR